MIVFSRALRADTTIQNAAGKLLSQLAGSRRRISLALLRRIVKDKSAALVMARDRKKIIGMGTIVFLAVPGGFHARLEDVVIDEQYRGKGLGRALTKKLIAIARGKKAEYVELTSRPSRVAANALYQKMGFEKKETNVYRMFLRQRFNKFSG